MSRAMRGSRGLWLAAVVAVGVGAGFVTGCGDTPEPEPTSKATMATVAEVHIYKTPT